MAIVTGGRDYANAARMKTVLDAAVEKLGLKTVIEGRCPKGGADRLAQEWTEARSDISLISVRPDGDWPSAGPRRNKMMRDILLAHEGDRAVFVFPGGNGTANMLALAKEYPEKIRVIEIDR